MKLNLNRTDPLPTNYRAALRGLSGNITVTAHETLAWFVERDVPWQFRSNAECEAALDGLVRAYTTLAGRTVHRRISQVTFPPAAWARTIDLDTPSPVDQGQWDGYLAAAQSVLLAHPTAEPLAFLGVPVGKGQGFVDTLRGLRDTPEQVADRETARFDAELAVITDGLSQIARPATQRELEWLLHRSVGLGLPAPDAEPHAGDDPLHVEDLAGFFESVDVDPGPPLSRTLKVTAVAGRNDVEPVERHLVIMSVGRMEEQRIPEAHGPWLARVLAHTGQVDISVRATIQAGPDAARKVQGRIDRILDQHTQRVRHGLLIPPHLTRTLAHAVEVQDLMEQAHKDSATTTDGWIRLAVSGATAKEATARAVALRRHMEAVRIALPVVAAQDGVYSEFIPGEKVATTAHRRRLPIRLWAAAVPQASNTIGDGRGLRLGHTVSGGVDQAPFFWDLHRAIEESDQAGFTPVVGEKGSGKSYLLGALLALSTLRGADCTGVDPAGQLAAICRWAPIAGHAKALHVLDSHMSPYGVFPKARVEDFEDHPDVTGLASYQDRGRRAYELAQAAESDAKFERRGLVLDMLRGCLPHGVAAHPATEQHLMAAVRRNGADFTSSAAGVLKELDVMRSELNDPQVGVLFDVLSELAEHPRARNWMSARYEPDQQVVDAGLLMLTMEGLALPSLTESPTMWSVSERLSLPLLALAVHYAYSRIYRKGDRNARKVFALDEAHYLENWASGKALTRKLRREDRRWNIRGLYASQDVLSTLDSDVGDALVTDAVVGNLSSEGEQAKATALLRVAPSFGPALGRLRPANDDLLAAGAKWRHFVVRVNGRVSRINVELPEVPDLLALLNTTPTQPDSGRGHVLAGSGEWFTR